MITPSSPNSLSLPESLNPSHKQKRPALFLALILVCVLLAAIGSTTFYIVKLDLTSSTLGSSHSQQATENIPSPLPSRHLPAPDQESIKYDQKMETILENQNEQIADLQNKLTAIATALSTNPNNTHNIVPSESYNQQQLMRALSLALTILQLQDSAKSGHSFSSEYKTALLFNSFLPEKTQKELVTLGAYADQNIPSANDLQKQFITYVPAIEKALDKDVAKTWTEQLQSQLSHLVVIHRIGAPINMPVLSNVSVPLARMDLKETVSAIQKLPPNVQLILSEWIKNVQAREQINTSAKIIADDIVTSGLDSLSQQDSLK